MNITIDHFCNIELNELGAISKLDYIKLGFHLSSSGIITKGRFNQEYKGRASILDTELICVCDNVYWFPLFLKDFLGTSVLVSTSRHHSKIISDLEMYGIDVFDHGFTYDKRKAKFDRTKLKQIQQVRIPEGMSIKQFKILTHEDVINDLVAKFPLIDVRSEMDGMVRWWYRNQKKKAVKSKKDWITFAINWLKRAEKPKREAAELNGTGKIDMNNAG